MRFYVFFLQCIFMRFFLYIQCIFMRFFLIQCIFYAIFFVGRISSSVDFVGFAVPPVFRQPFLPPSLLSFSAASTSSRLNYFRGRYHPCVCVCVCVCGGGQRDRFWEGAKKYPKNFKNVFFRSMQNQILRVLNTFFYVYRFFVDF